MDGFSRGPLLIPCQPFGTPFKEATSEMERHYGRLEPEPAIKYVKIKTYPDSSPDYISRSSTREVRISCYPIFFWFVYFRRVPNPPNQKKQNRQRALGNLDLSVAQKHSPNMARNWKQRPKPAEALLNFEPHPFEYD